MKERSSGILLHPTSLCNAYPIGDLGPAAKAFVDFMVESGQHWWQMLPVGPGGGENSPYKSSSAFAGNPLLISPDRLVEQGFLGRQDLGLIGSRVTDKVEYPEASRLKLGWLRKAYARFQRHRTSVWQSKFEIFMLDESYWLEDFTLFSALQEQMATSDWTQWGKSLRTRQPKDLLRVQKDLADSIQYHAFVQWQFSMQWKELKAYCSSNNIQLIGDIPLFVAHQSADVWSHAGLFKLNADGSPSVVAGVPPDYFCETGQLWELPVYRWEALRAQNYRWWIERLRTAFGRFNVNRLDHFIGFVRTYEVSAQAKTALYGQYQPSGGAAFFSGVHEALGSLPFIADDLGDTTPEVVSLLDQYQIPGNRVLQFEFEAALRSTSPLPAPHPLETVVYTGTHDNDTTAGWYAKLSAQQREVVKLKLGASDQEVVWAMIRVALASPARTAIVPAQDLLALGTEARMNLPGTAKGNWDWRLNDGVLTKKIAQRLRSITLEHSRSMNDKPVPAKRVQEGDLATRIAKRAYELYERRGHQGGHDEQDWLHAEWELRTNSLM